MKVICSDTDLSGKTLVLASPSSGGSSSLAFQIFINSNLSTLTRLGWIYSQKMFPYILVDAYDSESQTVGKPAELFLHGDFVILQIRTFPYKGKQLASDIVNWSLQKGIKEIIPISSNINILKVSQQAPDVFYMKNQEGKDFQFGYRPLQDLEELMKGIGISNHLLKQKKIPCTGLFTYSSPLGPDLSAGMLLAEIMTSFMPSESLRVPEYWARIGLVNNQLISR